MEMIRIPANIPPVSVQVGHQTIPPPPPLHGHAQPSTIGQPATGPSSDGSPVVRVGAPYAPSPTVTVGGRRLSDPTLGGAMLPLPVGPPPPPPPSVSPTAAPLPLAPPPGSGHHGVVGGVAPGPGSQLLMMSAAPPAAAATSAVAMPLPKQVLACPDCPFACVSNNQMARHMSLTMHGLRKCQHPSCNVRLVCFTFVQGVNKFLSRARKDRCLVEAISVDTPERHYDATHHDNATRVLQRDQYLRPRLPTDDVQIVQPPPPVNDSSKFRCPECGLLLATWSQMTKHLDSSRHAMSYCGRCNASLRCYGISQPARHEKHTRHHAIVGPYYQKKDFAIGAAPAGAGATGDMEPIAPSQWFCEACDVGFLNVLLMADHLMGAHGMRCDPEAQCLEPDCGFCGTVPECLAHRLETHHEDYELNSDITEPFAFSHLPKGPQLPLEPPMKPKNCLILFQCPTCTRIFSSWARMEQHLFSTKHSLPYCYDCGTLHKLRPITEDHQSTTSHRKVYGLQLAKVGYEVLVDMDDAILVRQIDERPPQAVDYDPTNAEVILYQCPESSCLRLFFTQLELRHHAEATHHGYVDCSACGVSELCVLDDDLFFHGHDIPGLPADFIPFRSEKVDFRVTAKEADVAAEFPQDFSRCEDCRSLITTEQATDGSHRGTLPCRASKAKRAAWHALQSSPTAGGGPHLVAGSAASAGGGGGHHHHPTAPIIKPSTSSVPKQTSLLPPPPSYPGQPGPPTFTTSVAFAPPPPQPGAPQAHPLAQGGTVLHHHHHQQQPLHHQHHHHQQHQHQQQQPLHHQHQAALHGGQMSSTTHVLTSPPGGQGEHANGGTTSHVLAAPQQTPMSAGPPGLPPGIPPPAPGQTIIVHHHSPGAPVPQPAPSAAPGSTTQYVYHYGGQPASAPPPPPAPPHGYGAPGGTTVVYTQSPYPGAPTQTTYYVQGPPPGASPFPGGFPGLPYQHQPAPAQSTTQYIYTMPAGAAPPGSGGGTTVVQGGPPSPHGIPSYPGHTVVVQGGPPPGATYGAPPPGMATYGGPPPGAAPGHHTVVYTNQPPPPQFAPPPPGASLPPPPASFGGGRPYHYQGREAARRR